MGESIASQNAGDFLLFSARMLVNLLSLSPSFRVIMFRISPSGEVSPKPHRDLTRSDLGQTSGHDDPG